MIMMHKLECVATEKMVRCVKNHEKEPSPPFRPPRRVVPPPSTLVPTSNSILSSPSYGPSDSHADEQEDKHGEDDQMDGQNKDKYCFVQRISGCSAG